ncbi:hypothetical protein [Microtetraspora sp. AC03309]|nr:hypothetical protein [Microtetraspora sp. AC03309]
MIDGYLLGRRGRTLGPRDTTQAVVTAYGTGLVVPRSRGPRISVR